MPQYAFALPCQQRYHHRFAYAPALIAVLHALHQGSISWSVCATCTLQLCIVLPPPEAWPIVYAATAYLCKRRKIKGDFSLRSMLAHYLLQQSKDGAFKRLSIAELDGVAFTHDTIRTPPPAPCARLQPHSKVAADAANSRQQHTRGRHLCARAGGATLLLKRARGALEVLLAGMPFGNHRNIFLCLARIDLQPIWDTARKAIAESQCAAAKERQQAAAARAAECACSRGRPEGPKRQRKGGSLRPRQGLRYTKAGGLHRREGSPSDSTCTTPAPLHDSVSAPFTRRAAHPGTTVIFIQGSYLHGGVRRSIQQSPNRPHLATLQGNTTTCKQLDRSIVPNLFGGIDGKQGYKP